MLVDKLSTTRPVLPLTEGELVGALVVAADESPIAAIKAVVGTYRDAELEAAAVEAVCAFLRAFGPGDEPNV